jgi:phosphonate transport system substrate-binding protein
MNLDHSPGRFGRHPPALPVAGFVARLQPTEFEFGPRTACRSPYGCAAAMRSKRDADMKQPLRVASHLAPGVLPLYAFLAERLADRLGRRAEFTVADSYARCARDIDDVCFVCSIPYLLFADEDRLEMEVVAAPVLIGDRYGGRPIYFSDVVVAADSRLECFADLRGAVWAYNEPFSHSGYIVVWHHLVAMGEGPGFFRRTVEAGFHSEALRMVADGRVDAAAIDSQVLAIELRDWPELAATVRVIGAIGPSTIQPVVASRSRLSPDERRAIAVELVGLADDPQARPLMDSASVERFVAMDGSGYDDIRRMLRRVHGTGFIGPEWRARWAAITGQTTSA